MLKFQTSEVYRYATEFVALAERIANTLADGEHNELAADLRRSSQAIPIRLAEADAPPPSSAALVEREPPLEVARGKALRCATLLDISHAVRVVRVDRYEEAMRALERVVESMAES